MNRQDEPPQAIADIRYHYPFANTSSKKAKIKPDFKLQTAIDKTKGTILEVGGPSPDGYLFLQGCTLPRRPLVTNISYKANVSKAYRQLYTPYIEKKLDLRKNNFKPQSIGICLASCLNTIASEPRFNHKKTWDKAWSKLADEDKTLIANPKATPKIGLRFILLHRGRDFLEKDGLFIIESLRATELKYALAIGFTLRAATASEEVNGENVYQSLILQR